MKDIDVYLKYPARRIVKSQELVDVTGGIIPVYYMRDGDSLLVSSSAAELIRASDGVQRNVDFHPPEWFSTSRSDDIELRGKRIFGDIRLATIKESPPDPSWYASWQTADRRVFKLRPHETVSMEHSRIEFDPTSGIRSKVKLAERVAEGLTASVQWIETKYPDAQHVVLTGGMDSMLIHLVPKKNNKNWHVFSGDPNYEIVLDWLATNDLQVGDVYRGDSINRETMDELRRKIAASDLYSDPRHIRWLPHLKQIANSYDERVIIWTGTEGGAFFAFHPVYHQGPAQRFWRLQQSRAPSWQGNYHQTAFNFTGAPVLSIYHTPHMVELMSAYDPEVISRGDDIRPMIGRELAGAIEWPTSNPGPEPYSYEKGLQSHAIYYNYLTNSSMKSIFESARATENEN